MRVFAAVLPLFLLAFPAAAQVIRVPQDQPTIQQAINAATNGTTILVAPGTYTQLLTVSAKTLTIRGEGGAAVTTLQANNGRALTLSSGAVVTLENFTVRPQFTPAMAGIMVTSSTLHLRACVLRDSQAPSGAALQLSGASQATVSSCEFLSNSATNFGGAISVVNNGALVVHNSAFRQNSSGIAGGAIDLQPGTAALANCLFANNSSANGGALATVSTGSSFRNCTLVGNSSGPGVGYAVAVAGIFSNAVALHNSIVWGNTGGAHTSALGSTSSGTTFLVTYSDVQGGHPGPGNISADPSFAPGGSPSDYRPGPGSPCIDAGDNAMAPADTLDLDNDLNTSESLPIDLGGEPRFVDDPQAPNTGQGPGPVVDMGARERQPPATCPADFNGDSSITTGDISAFLSAWFQAVSGGCP